ncbi:MAG: hypothetical protein ACREFY_15135 [Acetobacteraceae bacterium]
MSGSRRTSKTTKEKIGWPTVQRRPVRNELAAIRAEVLVVRADVKADDGPKKVSRDALILRLDAAEKAAYRPAKGDKQKQASCDDAQAILNEVDRGLKLLITAQKVPNPSSSPPRPAQKLADLLPKSNDQTRADTTDLKTRTAALRKKIFDKKAIVYGIQLPEDRSYNALMSACEGLQLAIDAEIVTTARKAVLDGTLVTITSAFDISLPEAEAWPPQRDDMLAKIKTFRKELAPLKAAIEKLGGDPDKVSREIGSLTQLQVRVGGAPADVKRATAAFTAHAQLVAAAKAKNPTAYARELMGEARESADVGKEQQKVRDALGARSMQLRNICDALGGGDTAMADEYDRLLTRVGVPDAKGNSPNTAEEISDLGSWMDDAIDHEGGRLQALRGEAAKLHAAVLSEVGTARSATGNNPALVVDWKVIDGIIAAYDAQIDGTAEVNAASVRALVAAKGLDAQIRARLAAMKGDDGAIKPGLVTFAADLRTIKEGLEDDRVAGKKSPLGTYFGDSRDALNKSLKQFEKDVAMLPGGKAADQLTALKKLFDAKLNEATEIAASVITANNLISTQTIELAGLKAAGKKRGVKVPSENAVSLAIKALKKLLEEKPPSKTSIEAGCRALTDALKPGVTTAESLRDGAQQAVTDKAAAKGATKDKQAELEARQRQVSAMVDTAAKVVEKAGGDTVAVDAVKAMLKEAKTQVKAGDSGAEATFVNIVGRCDMLIAHPEGEVNRTRNELPKLYGEWQALLRSAASQMNATIATVQTYTPDPLSPDVRKTTDGLAKLCVQLAEYRDRFSADGPRLGRPLGVLASADEGVTETARRKAREDALAIIGEMRSTLQGNPLSGLLAKCPIKGASSPPGQLNVGLSRLQYTILTSVRN